jgi:prepilin-type N-terminal cleavage/methylation domain-containing protein
MRRGDRRGFTLLEVLVALAISAVVMAGARGLLDALASSADGAVQHAHAVDDRANGARRVRDVVLRLSVQDDSAGAFEGTSRDARFRTWCDAPGGWEEPCAATLTASRAGEENALTLTLSTGDVVRLRAGARDIHLIYLASAELGGSWRDDWARSIVTPLAIGVVADGDTALFRVGVHQ